MKKDSDGWFMDFNGNLRYSPFSDDDVGLFMDDGGNLIPGISLDGDGFDYGFDDEDDDF